MAWKKKPKKQTAIKGKSSAFLITVIIHAALLIGAGYFVAMEVIEQKEAKFTAKQVQRPKMKLQKLKMPVKMQRKIKRAPPKLSQRVTANARLNTKAAQFKMPEISGFGGGGGGLSDSKLGAGNLGFANMQLNVFGAKSKGEKILFVLSADAKMLEDQMGGIPAYRIIKREITQLIDSLPPTALFNVVLLPGWGPPESLFKNLSPASPANRQKLKDWISPLNESQKTHGLESLANRGLPIDFVPCIPIGTKQQFIIPALAYAVKQEADSVFWLAADATLQPSTIDAYKAYRTGKVIETKKWSGEKSPEFVKLLERARAILKKENDKRLANGKPVRVIAGGDYGLVKTLLPNATLPESSGNEDKYYYDSSDVLDYMENYSKKLELPPKSKMRFNLIHFVPQSVGDNQKAGTVGVLRAVCQKYRGAFRELRGMKGIKSASSTE